MEYCLEMVKKKVNGYLDGSLSKEALGKWGKSAYYDLLRGGYLKKDKIILYPFIKTISQVNIKTEEENDIYPASRSDIEFVQSVVSGAVSYCFQVEISVPKLLYSMPENDFLSVGRYEKMLAAKAAVENYIRSDNMAGALTDSIEQIKNTEKTAETILDLLQNQIVMLGLSLLDCRQKKAKPRLSLYPQQAHKNAGVEKLLQYLKCFTGEETFIAVVSYKNGEPNMSVIV